jgi:hypothetical protein
MLGIPLQTDVHIPAPPLADAELNPSYPPLSFQVEVILRAVSPKTEQNRSSIRTAAPGTSVRLGVLRSARQSFSLQSAWRSAQSAIAVPAPARSW